MAIGQSEEMGLNCLWLGEERSVEPGGEKQKKKRINYQTIWIAEGSLSQTNRRKTNGEGTVKTNQE